MLGLGVLANRRALVNIRFRLGFRASGSTDSGVGFYSLESPQTYPNLISPTAGT